MRSPSSPPRSRKGLYAVGLLACIVLACAAYKGLQYKELQGQGIRVRESLELSLPQRMVNLPQRLYLLQSLRQATMEHDHDRATQMLSGLSTATQEKGQGNKDSSELTALKQAQTLATQKMHIAHDLQQMVLMQRLRDQVRSQPTPTNLPDAKLFKHSKLQQQKRRPPASQVCIVVRTQAAHGPSADGKDPGSLRRLIESLRVSPNISWQMLLVVSEAFPALQPMLDEMSDHRITVNVKLGGYPEGELLEMTHAAVLNATDQAIQVCSPHSRWVTVTAGDNAYDPAFWLEVAKGPAYASVLAFDYYSQHQRQTVKQCERFEPVAKAGVPPCKENLLRFGHTDLAATLLDWQRWMVEGWKYTTESLLTATDKQYGFHDANVVQHVIKAGWEVHFVKPGSQCLLATGPCPHLCAIQGGVWDDSSKDSGGGRCLTEDDSTSRLASRTSAVEVTEVQLDYDTTTFWWQGAQPAPLLWQRPGNTTTIKCLHEIREMPVKERIKRAPRLFSQQCDLIDQDATVIARTNHQLDTMLTPVPAIRHVAWKEETSPAQAFIDSHHQLLTLAAIGASVLAVFGLIKAYSRRSRAAAPKLASKRSGGDDMLGTPILKGITVRRSLAESPTPIGTPTKRNNQVDAIANTPKMASRFSGSQGQLPPAAEEP